MASWPVVTLRSFGVFIDTGARLSEVADLKTADIDLDDQTLTVTGKGSRVRVLPIGAKSVKAIDRYLRVQRSDLSALLIGRIQPRRASKGVGDVVVGTAVPPRGLIRPSLAVGSDAAGLAFSTRMVCRIGRIGGTRRVSIDRTGDGRVVPGRSTIVRHDRRRYAMVLMRFRRGSALRLSTGSRAMSILERSASPQVSAAESVEHSGRLSVITAGHVGNMDALLGANGFDVVAVAQTEDALIDAVSADEPDAIVVEAEMCTSLEHVRDLAPDAVLIVVGDHTPAGALGRIERGVSGTVMAGLLHALVAEGIGGAVGWGLVPAFGPRGALQVPQRISGWLLSGKGDLVRAYVANALRDHTELMTAATTVAVTVSAGVLLTLSGPGTNERPARIPIPASAVERTPQERLPQHPVFAVSPATPTSTHGPSGNESEPGDRRRPNRGDSRDLGRPDGPGENEHEQGEDNDNQGVNEGSDDQGVNEGSDDQVVEEGNDPHGKSEDPHGQNEEDHGKNEDPHGKNGDPHGQNEDDHGKNEGDHGVNQDNDDRGENGSEGDQAEDSDDQGENEGSDDQGVDGNDQVVEESNDDQGEDN